MPDPAHTPHLAVGRPTGLLAGQVRHEIKYVVRPVTARRIVSLLADQLVDDPHAAGGATRGYTVRSVYLDSPSLECFRLKTGGQQFREKYRVRTYGGPGEAPVALEVKQKRGTDYIKLKLGIDARAVAPGASRPLLDWMPAAAGDAGAELARQRMTYRLRARGYRPTVVVAYERDAYVGRWDPTLRFTFDRHVRARPAPGLSAMFGEWGWSRLLDDWVIVEVKFTRRVPRWMGLIQRRCCLKLQACSKYCIAAAALFGEEVRAGARHA